jgi:hypothetical protein
MKDLRRKYQSVPKQRPIGADINNSQILGNNRSSALPAIADHYPKPE